MGNFHLDGAGEALYTLVKVLSHRQTPCHTVTHNVTFRYTAPGQGDLSLCTHDEQHV